MKPSSICALALLPLLLAGCALWRIGDAKQAQSDLVGKRKAEILACAGKPDRTRQEGEFEYLTYLRFASPEGELASRRSLDNTALQLALEKKRYCEATFVIRGDRVQGLRYAGRTGGLVTQGEQCGFIVAPCLK
ncbi:MAG: hypothetical protein QNJ94_07265 [Alphaproteobacteria bacterium]|nr:hypothetical protein [Alphaproteobacteria bacterium]